MIKITYKREYRLKFDPEKSAEENQKRVGKLVYVYGVTGTADELKAYKKSKGVHYKEDKDTKEPLYFTDRLVGNCSMFKTEKGEFVPDTKRADMLLNLLKQGHTHESAKEIINGILVAAPAPAEETD